MKYTLIALLFCFQTSFGQADSTIYIKEMGWILKLPSDFKIVGIQNNDTSTSKNLITASNLEGNYFSADIEILDTITNDNWQNFDSFAKQGLEKLFEKKSNSSLIEKTQSNVILDGVEFKSLYAKFENKEHGTFRFLYLSTFYRRHYFHIQILYSTPTGNEIIEMINNSKFDK